MKRKSSENGLEDEEALVESTNENPGMADAMRRVLQMGRNLGKSVILAKAKTTSKLRPKPHKETLEIETVPGNEQVEETEIKVEPGEPQPKKKKVKKQEIAAMGRLKPSALDRDKERPLIKIATKGVVQLFNAVGDQQKLIHDRLKDVGSSERKRENVLKSIDKKTFLDVLRGQPNKEPKNEEEEIEIKTENEEDDNETSTMEPSWSVLRDDFMMGAKLKDWENSEKKNDENE